jgi:hypothetical protein
MAEVVQILEVCVSNRIAARPPMQDDNPGFYRLAKHQFKGQENDRGAIR